MSNAHTSLGSRVLCCGVLLAACAAPEDRGQPWVTLTSTSSTDGAESSASSSSDSALDSSGASETEGDTTDGDADGSASTSSADCTLPDAAPPWLDEHLREVVGVLSGELDVEPGVRLSDRASAARRELSAAWLVAHLGEHGLDAEPHAYGTGTNIVARVPATGTSLGTYVVGAHYHSVPGSPGANDNASGTAVVTALARWLLTLPCRGHDVLLVAFDEEELGLVGSAAFAAKLVADDEPVISVHTIDQIAWDADGDRAVELERPDAGLFEFYADVASEVPGLGELRITDTGFTDHVSFRALGFAAIGISEEYASGDTTPHYHMASDRFDTVDFAYVATASTLINRAFGRAVGEP